MHGIVKTCAMKPSTIFCQRFSNMKRVRIKDKTQFVIMLYSSEAIKLESVNSSQDYSQENQLSNCTPAAQKALKKILFSCAWKTNVV